MKVALVHDFLMQQGGAERVLAVLHDMFPNAPVYTLLADEAGLPEDWRSWDIRPFCPFQASASVRRRYKKLFPVYPRYVDRLDLRGYDLILSSSYAYAHGVHVPEGSVHVTYCHTPMRFVWFQEDEYRQRIPSPARPVYDLALRRLRKWDREASRRPTRYVSNCGRMARRISAVYERDADVVYPPVSFPFQDEAVCRDKGYYLIVARLVYPYKRIDLAIEAFRRLNLPLRIVGEGEDRGLFEQMAEGAPVEFLGRIDDRELAEVYAGCRALVMPWDEDFGIAPVEANLFGKPVVGFRGSGLAESQIDGDTVVFFDRLDADALIDAVRECERRVWNVGAIRRSAMRFSEAAFRGAMGRVIDSALGEVGHVVTRRADTWMRGENPGEETGCYDRMRTS